MCAAACLDLKEQEIPAGVTDNEWYPFLAARGLDEVNFWRPLPGPCFTSQLAGTPFLFKF